VWTSISLGAGLAAALTGLIGVLWLAKRLVDAHGHERDALKTQIDLSKKVDDLGRGVEDRDHALDAVNEQLHGEQQARLLAEKHRTELLAAMAKIAPSHILIAGINDELRLLSNLSQAAPTPGNPPADPVHGAAPVQPSTP
jgi:hypothetical protein